MRGLEREERMKKQKKESSDKVSVAVLGETVKQNDSAELFSSTSSSPPPTSMSIPM